MIRNRGLADNTFGELLVQSKWTTKKTKNSEIKLTNHTILGFHKRLIIVTKLERKSSKKKDLMKFLILIKRGLELLI